MNWTKRSSNGVGVQYKGWLLTIKKDFLVVIEHKSMWQFLNTFYVLSLM